MSRRKRQGRGNFREGARSVRPVLLESLLPAPTRRAFARVRAFVAARAEGAPFVFFGVVIGVALLFRLFIGAVKEPELVAEPSVVHERPAASATSTSRAGAVADPAPLGTSARPMTASAVPPMAPPPEPLRARPARRPPRRSPLR